MSYNRIALLCLLGLLLGGCQQDQKSLPWLPVLEPSSFSHLEDTVDKGLDKLGRAEDDLAAGDQEEARIHLLEGKRALLELRHYFVPMTRVRQLVYDAERLYVLNRVEEARDNLNQARDLLIGIGNSDGEVLKETVNEVEVMIDRLLLAIEQSQSNVSDLFETLGHKANMLAIKGDLVLSGVRFTGER